MKGKELNAGVHVLAVGGGQFCMMLLGMCWLATVSAQAANPQGTVPNHATQVPTPSPSPAPVLIFKGVEKGLPETGTVMTRIAFGSCSQQAKPQPVWKAVQRLKPDLFIFTGDAAYLDTEDSDLARDKYSLMGGMPEYQAFIKTTPIIATWDDHDFGMNDGDRTFPKKQEMKKLFLDFFGEPQGSLRRSREGIYESYEWGPVGKRLQVILLDTRWFRTPLRKETRRDGSRWNAPDRSAGAQILGEKQWAWLEEQLKRPADLRLLVSSIQFVSDQHGAERWGAVPRERDRLLKFLDTQGIKNLLILSGDRHQAEFSCLPRKIFKESLSVDPMGGRTQAPLMLCDFTASGLNQSQKKVRPLEPNPYREMFYDDSDHFGWIEIDWNLRRAKLELRSYKKRILWSRWFKPL